MSNLLSQASLVMIPSGYKEDVVYSPVPTDGSGDLSFTRASNGTRINSSGLVEVCPWNLLQQSNAFSTSPWSSSGASVTITSGQTDPNGGTNAFLYARTLAYDFISQSIPQNKYTAFCTVKKGTSDFFRIADFLGGDAIFNINTGVVTSASSGVTATIESLGNGWYKCIAYFDYNNGGFYLQTFPVANGLNGNGSVYIYQAQCNIGSTAKPYFPTTDRLNVPRLTYQNGGGGCPSLLLEKQSTNYARKNNDLVDWGIVNSGSLTKNLNAATSPDGTTNAINLVPNTANSAKMIYDNLTLQLAGGNFTMSCYAKANGYSKFGVRESATVGYYATFNLSTGTVIDNGGNTASIESVGNGWYRCIVSVVYSGTVNIGLLPLDDSYTSGQPLSYSYTGDGTKGVLVYGPQLEVSSSYATSLISTAGVASATRVADECYKTGIGSLFGTNKGTFFWQGVTPYFVSGAAQYLWDISDTINFNLNRFALYMVGTNLVQLYTSVTGGNNATLAQNSFAKIALVWNGTSCSLYINGAVAISNQTISNSNPTAIHLNTRYSLNENGNTEVGEVVVFNTNLTNAELIALTTI